MTQPTLNAALTRREALTLLGALGALGTLGATRFRTLIPAPPFAKIGLQLYTVRNLLPRDVSGTLASVAQIGYREVETAGYGNVSPAEFRKALDAAGLSAPSAHVDLDAIDTGLSSTLEACAAVGHKWLVVASLPTSVRSADGYKKGDTFARAATAAKSAGVRIAYHNHDVDFAPVDGTTGMDLLLSSTPATVAAELDVYWIVKAGGDPFAFIAKHPGRVKMLHLKDATPAPERAMADVGSGTIDWPRLLAAGKKAGVEHVFVEHDRPADALASIRASFDYLNRIGTSNGRS